MTPRTRSEGDGALQIAVGGGLAAIVIGASYPGASAEVVSDTVSTPLEQEINGVENMLYMSLRGPSRSRQKGVPKR